MKNQTKHKIYLDNSVVFSSATSVSFAIHTPKHQILKSVFIYSSEYSEGYSEHQSMNNNIESAEYFVQNEQWINEMFFKLTADTYEPSFEDIEQIDALAVQCPYLAGEAVYKARTLNATYYPAKTYDDLMICNSNGVYKNGEGLFDAEQKQLDSLMNGANGLSILGNLIKVYPNPANNRLTVEYSLQEGQSADFIIYDLTGRQVQSLPLNAQQRKIDFQLLNMASGVYTYKFITNGQSSQVGKLLISK